MSKQPVTLGNIDLAPKPPAPAAAPAPAPAAPPPSSPPPQEEPRVPVTTRLRASTTERLRILAFQTRREKQDLIEDALDQFMTRNGV